MVHSSTLFTLKTLCVRVALLESLVMTRVICHDSSHSLTRVNMRSSQSQIRVISHVTRVKSCHLGEISSQVKSTSQKLQLESTRVRVSDLTCYNTDLSGGGGGGLRPLGPIIFSSVASVAKLTQRGGGDVVSWAPRKKISLCYKLYYWQASKKKVAARKLVALARILAGFCPNIVTWKNFRGLQPPPPPRLVRPLSIWND